MKILWKNLIWNHTERYWLLLRYFWYGDYLSKFSSYYYPYKMFYTKKQQNKFEYKVFAELEKILRQNSKDE